MTKPVKVEARNLKEAKKILHEHYQHIVSHRVLSRPTKNKIGQYEFMAYGRTAMERELQGHYW